MKETDIRKYAGLMEELGLTGLEITEDNKVVRMERTNQSVSPQQVFTAEQLQQLLAVTLGNQGLTAAPVQTAVSAQQGMAAAPVQAGGDCISVKSPIVGVFYAASAENAAPFVSLGDRVEKGKTLCIIEAMKLMNEIHAEESGEIVEICVTNGQVVEYGTELFKIRR